MRRVIEDDNIIFIFRHLRNFLIGVTVFSVGVYLLENPGEVTVPVHWVEGILITLVGFSLIMLNLTHAIKKVIQAGMNVWTAIPVAILYCIVIYRFLDILKL